MRPRPLTVLVAASVLAIAGSAQADQTAMADTSAWLSLQGGTTLLTVNESEVVVRGSMAFDIGMGTSPSEPFIFGGLVRVAPIIEEGTDMQFLLRGASRGFQVGDWGVAVDLGSYLRLFDVDHPGGGFAGGALLGAPYGLQLAVMGHAGTESSFGASATLGLDILRLILFRQTGTEYWTNPLAPGGEVASAAFGVARP